VVVGSAEVVEEDVDVAADMLELVGLTRGLAPGLVTVTCRSYVLSVLLLDYRQCFCNTHRDARIRCILDLRYAAEAPPLPILRRRDIIAHRQQPIRLQIQMPLRPVRSIREPPRVVAPGAELPEHAVVGDIAAHHAWSGVAFGFLGGDVVCADESVRAAFFRAYHVGGAVDGVYLPTHCIEAYLGGVEEDGAGCALVVVEVCAPEGVGVTVAYVDVVPLICIQVWGRHCGDLYGSFWRNIGYPIAVGRYGGEETKHESKGRQNGEACGGDPRVLNYLSSPVPGIARSYMRIIV
jgi:hypothetical protein